MSTSGLGDFLTNIKTLPQSIKSAMFRDGAPKSDRTRSQAVFNNLFLHIHATRVYPRSLKLTFTWGLGIFLISAFIILTVTGALLMVYYKPSLTLAYDSIKELHFVVPSGRFLRNIHRWGAQLMVAGVFLHMARVFYTASYKKPREFNWVVGMGLFVLTLALSFTGYLLPWDQLAYWAITIGANIAASPNELVNALGLPPAYNVGTIQKELLLGGQKIGEDALIRFYVLHIFVLPLAAAVLIALHVWRIRKDGGMSRPDGNPTTASKGVGTMTPQPVSPKEAPQKTYGLMCVVKDKTGSVGNDPDETAPAWPYLLRAELLVFMATMLICVILGYYFDAPLKEPANPAIPENPAKAPWYFLGLQEVVSYSAFIGGVFIPALAMVGLGLIPFLDREKEPAGVWFSGKRGRNLTISSLVVGTISAIVAVAVPVNFGWLRNWFPDIHQLYIILINPGSLLTLIYVIYSLVVMKATKSTRMGAMALFSCFLAGFLVLTYVGTYLRGPNWDFFWSQASWPVH